MPPPAIERDAEIKFLGDVHARRDDKHRHRHAFGAGLVTGHAIRQHESGGISCFLLRFYELDEARLTAPTGIDLRFHNAERLIELFVCGRRLLRGMNHLGRRDGNVVLAQKLPRLVLVNFHRDESVTPHGRGGEPRIQSDSMTDVAAPHDPYQAFRFPNYRNFAAANAMAVLGSQIQIVAIGWELWNRTHSMADLGWLGLVQAAPVMAFALPSGHVADTYSRKNIIIVTQLIAVLSALGLAVLAATRLPVALWLPLAYAMAFLRSSAMTFFRPARNAILPSLLPNEAFTNAVTWNSSIQELSSMIGPAAGGLLLAVSLPASYALAASLQLAFPLLAGRLTIVHSTAHRPPATLESLAAGIRFVTRTKLLLAVMSLDLFAVLFGGAAYLLPWFADKRLHVGAIGFGWLRAAPAVGAVGMSLMIAHAPPFRRAGRVLLIAVAGYGAATIAFGFCTHMVPALLLWGMTGAFDNVSVVIRNSMVQLLTPDEMRGRVSAVNQVFIGASNEIGGLESGLTAAWFGPFASIVGGGIITVIVVAIIAKVFPSLRYLGTLKDIMPSAVPADDRPAARRGRRPFAISMSSIRLPVPNSGVGVNCQANP